MFLPNQIGTKSAHFFFALISVYVVLNNLSLEKWLRNEGV